MLLDGCLVEKWKDQLNKRFKVNIIKEKNADILHKKLNIFVHFLSLNILLDIQICRTLLGIITFTSTF